MASSKHFIPGQPSLPITINMIEDELKTLLKAINLIEDKYYAYDHFDNFVSKELEVFDNDITMDIGILGHKIKRALNYVEVNKTK